MKFGYKALALAASMFFTAPAVAADLGGSGGYKDMVETAPMSLTWTGFVVSLGISTDVLSGRVDGESASVSYRDFAIDGRLAYNYQFVNSPMVIGAYGEIGYNGVYDSFHANAMTESFGGTIGLAIGNVKPYVLLGAEFADSFNQKGFAFGGGVEFKVSQHWVLGAEWRRINWDTTVSWLNVDEDRISARIGYKF